LKGIRETDDRFSFVGITSHEKAPSIHETYLREPVVNFIVLQLNMNTFFKYQQSVGVTVLVIFKTDTV
jgi:hypothetical protein